MRLLIVGRLNGQITTAVKMAMSAGAKVAHVETCAGATQALIDQMLVGMPARLLLAKLSVGAHPANGRLVVGNLPYFPATE